jgi:hypothetical protein
MQDMQAREWRYRAPWRTVIWTTLLFGACAVLIGHKAAHNDRGVIINRVVDLDVQGATRFYWGLAAASAALVLIGLLLGYQTATTRKRIAIGGGMLTMPAKRWGSEEVTIPLREIERVRMQSMSGQRSLQLWHGGKKYLIAGARLPRKRDFDELLAEIAAHVPAQT